MTAQFSATLLEQLVTQKVLNFHIKIFLLHATRFYLMPNLTEKNLTLAICPTLIRLNRYLLFTALLLDRRLDTTQAIQQSLQMTVHY